MNKTTQRNSDTPSPARGGPGWLAALDRLRKAKMAIRASRPRIAHRVFTPAAIPVAAIRIEAPQTFQDRSFAIAPATVETCHDALVRRRIELNGLIRRAKLIRNAVPHLADRPWANAWRSSFTREPDRMIRRYSKELETIADRIGPAPKLFKLRSLPGADRIERNCRHLIKKTPMFRWRAARRRKSPSPSAAPRTIRH